MSCWRLIHDSAELKDVHIPAAGLAGASDVLAAHFLPTLKDFVLEVQVQAAARSSPQQVQQWIEQHGPVITLTNGADIHVVIGRHEEVVLLMEKQGAVLADRPYSIASNEILSRGLKFMQMSTCARFQTYRKAARSELQMKAALIYDNDQAQYARNIVLDILKAPESHQGHIKRHVLGGHNCSSDIWKDDADVSKRFLHPPSAAHGPYRTGALMPGAGQTLSTNKFINNVKQTKIGLTQLAISTILMAAAHFPDIQEIVQEETNSVVGRDTQALRWRPVNPLGKSYLLTVALLCADLWVGVPHRAAKDVIWNGYCIAANAIVSGSHWCISRDPEVFPDLETLLFWLWAEDMPGLNLANRAMFIAVATVMWAFTIKEDFSNRYNAFELPAAIVSHHKPYSILYEPRTDVGWLKEVMSGQMDKSSFDVGVAWTDEILILGLVYDSRIGVSEFENRESLQSP
ncbi:cytochrome P450 [Melanogaster broomeanus]|nr:cytochrome P450 [Melanogaster broomeanus]